MNIQRHNYDLLVVDDSPVYRKLVEQVLEPEPFRLHFARNGVEALQMTEEFSPSIVLTDWMMPDFSGLELCKKIRADQTKPYTYVIVMTSNTEKGNVVSALDAGADDYLTKPFGSGELLARLRVLLRRAQTPEEAGAVKFGAIEVDFSRRVVTRNGTEVRLTAKEYALLRLLVTNRDKVITHRQVLREVWGPKAEDQTHYLRVYMARLRQKLEDEPNQPRYFRTEAGIGYRFVGE